MQQINNEYGKSNKSKFLCMCGIKILVHLNLTKSALGMDYNYDYHTGIENNCQCNSYLLPDGRGNCKKQGPLPACGVFCYVNQGNQCPDALTDRKGAPYEMSCEACKIRNQEFIKEETRRQEFDKKLWPKFEEAEEIWRNGKKKTQNQRLPSISKDHFLFYAKKIIIPICGFQWIC